MCAQQLYSSGDQELIDDKGPLWQNFTLHCNPEVTNSPCNGPTLNWIAENVTGTPHVRVHIEIRLTEFWLTGRVEFEHHRSVTISGVESTAIRCRERDSGLVFTNVDAVTISSITLTNCGTHNGNSVYYFVIGLLHCRDIAITNVSIERNNATGLSITDHQGGTVRISHSQFVENSITGSESESVRGGGGIFVGNYEYDPPIAAMYYFEDCTFARNIPHTRFYNLEYTDELGQPISGFGRGGGVFLAFEIPLTDVHAEFSNCRFLENAGFLGGGLSVDITGGETDEATNITVIVRDSIFEVNGCSPETPTGSGGGALLSFYTLNRQKLSSSQFYFLNVNFSSNCAELGGGVYFFSDRREGRNDWNSLTFERCTFTRNRAHTGTAIDLTPNIFDRLSDGFLVVPTLKDCNFLFNMNIRSLNTETTFGTGTIYSSQHSLYFLGNSEFMGNSGTALYMVNGIADFSNGSVTFEQNRGNRGGAVALIGFSSLLVGAEGNYIFKDNTAMDSGGALYSLMIDNHDFTVSRSCFIQHVNASDQRRRITPLFEWSANIVFVGNRARAGTGHAIFATSLYPCQVVNNGTTNRYDINIVVNISDVFSVRGITLDKDPLLQPQVATEGAKLRHSGDLPLKIIPGEQYKHRVTLTDDLDEPVQATFQASVSNDSTVSIDSAFSSCLSDQITLKGEPKQTAELLLQTVSQRQTFIRLDVEMINCPPGFILENNECICNFYVHMRHGFLRCDMNTLHSYIIPGFWIGLVASDEGTDVDRRGLATGICPPGFCDYNKSYANSLASGIKLPQNTSRLDEVICGRSRTGTLCGVCETGYTVHFHSPNFLCKPAEPALCKVGWLFYILSELVPVTVVFITVLILNISFTSGAINGFILFSQLINSLNIDARGLIVLPDVTLIFVRGYRVIYGFFNLDYFNVETLSYCLWSNASALDMIALKYVTIAYALLLIVTVLWFMNKYGGRCLGKWCRISKLNSSITHGISTFLVICYAQCVYISLTLLLRYRNTPPVGSQLKDLNVVWLNGNLDYFSRRHLPYALPALACMLTIGILPPILLLTYPLVYKILAIFGLEDSRPINFVFHKLPVISLKPLFDSFQGCFKDDLRFFAGLYFLYRWIGLAVNASTSSNSTFFTAVGILLLCVLALHAICQPYSKRAHNIIDTLLLTNLAVINAISFANYYIVRNNGEKDYQQREISVSTSIQLVLIYIPVMIMLGYMIIKCYLFISDRKQAGESKAQTGSHKLHKLISIVSNISVDDEEELPHRLTASESEYRNFEDSDYALSVQRETEFIPTY
jgi:hypothetical protein